MAREPLMSLEEKLDPNWTALVCIDYQNDFCADGGSLDRCGLDVAPMAAIAPSLGRLVDRTRDAGAAVIFVRNSYTTKQGWYLSDVSYAQSQRTLRGLNHDVPHCETGTWGWDYYGDVRPRDGDCEVIKHRYDAFIDTDLDLVLRSRAIRTLIVCGVTTNVCVESTARHAFFLDYYCVVAVLDHLAVLAASSIGRGMRGRLSFSFATATRRSKVGTSRTCRTPNHNGHCVASTMTFPNDASPPWASSVMRMGDHGGLASLATWKSSAA